MGRFMSLLQFYWSRARFCDDAARVSTDPKIIKSLKDEGDRYRALADKLARERANENDPYSQGQEEAGKTSQNRES